MCYDVNNAKSVQVDNTHQIMEKKEKCLRGNQKQHRRHTQRITKIPKRPPNVTVTKTASP